MKHQSPNLNTLPRRKPYLGLGIHKRGMRHPPRTTIRLRIKALDQRDQIGGLAVAIIPSVLRVGSHGTRLPRAVGVDQRHGDEVRVGDGVGVCDREGVLVDRLDGSPDVDDLVATLEQGFGFVGQVVRHAAGGCGVGLVDVHALDGPAELGCGSAGVRGVTADGVVEN
jgi:hypothetical protein